MFLSVIGIPNVYAQHPNFVDSLVKSMPDLVDFIAELEAEVAPCRAWQTKRDMGHLQGKFTTILTQEGESFFKELFESTGYHGLYDSYFADVCKPIPTDSVLHYYYNHMKPVKYDSVTYVSESYSWGEDRVTAEFLGYETSIREYYKFYNKGKLVMEIYVYWEDNAFRTFRVDIAQE